MADLAKKGTYVKLQVQVWYDKKQDRIHITSQDPDLPSTGMHMSAKKGTQSDANLRALLDKFACGPQAAAMAVMDALASQVMVDDIDAGELDAHLDKLEYAILQRKEALAQ